jgi:aminoglycoside 6'-N-acetyltransferase I
MGSVLDPYVRRKVKIVDLSSSDKELIDRLATLSVRASRIHSPNWLRTVEDAYETIEEALQPEKVCRALLDDGKPLGWVAAGPSWGRVWELHPLLVDPDHHRRGYGRLLAMDIERFATDAGALTMQLGTSDTTGATNLSGIDLYGDPIGALSRIGVVDETAGHAFQFWCKLGYTVVGVLPDAEGAGMPSISLAKRLSR